MLIQMFQNSKPCFNLENNGNALEISHRVVDMTGTSFTRTLLFLVYIHNDVFCPSEEDDKKCKVPFKGRNILWDHL